MRLLRNVLKISVLVITFITITAATVNAAADEHVIIEILKETKGNKFLAHDMYLNIFKEIHVDTEKTALDVTAAGLGMSPDDVNDIVNKGDLGSLLKNNKDQTIEKMLTQYDKTVSRFSDELATISFKKEIGH